VVEDVIVGIGPEAVVVVLGWPERVVEEIVVGVRPEHRAEPADEAAAVKAAPLVEETVAVVVVAVTLAERPAQRRDLGGGQTAAADGLAETIALLRTSDAIAGVRLGNPIAVVRGRPSRPGRDVGSCQRPLAGSGQAPLTLARKIAGGAVGVPR